MCTRPGLGPRPFDISIAPDGAQELSGHVVVGAGSATSELLCPVLSQAPIHDKLSQQVQQVCPQVGIPAIHKGAQVLLIGTFTLQPAIVFVNGRPVHMHSHPLHHPSNSSDVVCDFCDPSCLLGFVTHTYRHTYIHTCMHACMHTYAYMHA